MTHFRISVEDNVKEIEWEGVHVIRLSQNTDTWPAAVGKDKVIPLQARCGPEGG